MLGVSLAWFLGFAYATQAPLLQACPAGAWLWIRLTVAVCLVIAGLDQWGYSVVWSQSTILGSAP